MWEICVGGYSERWQFENHLVSIWLFLKVKRVSDSRVLIYTMVTSRFLEVAVFNTFLKWMGIQHSSFHHFHQDTKKHIPKYLTISNPRRCRTFTLHCVIVRNGSFNLHLPLFSLVDLCRKKGAYNIESGKGSTPPLGDG